MGYNIGVNLKELDGRASPGVIAAPTSVAGFVIRSARGPVGTVETVTSWSAFVERYGNHSAGLASSYAVKGFFDNGGVMARVTRISEDGAKAAQWNLGDLVLASGYRGISSPGSWPNTHVRVTTSRTVDGVFELKVYVDGAKDPTERWSRLSAVAGATREATRVLNDASTGSRYVMAIKVAAPTWSGSTSPPTKDLSLDPGVDGTPTSANFTTALSLLERASVQLVLCPDASDPAAINAALVHCVNMGDRIFIGHTPKDMAYGVANTWADTNGLVGGKNYGALYFPWVKVQNSTGGLELVPPDGHIAGVYARTERERGVWKAPAGNQAFVLGALDLQYHLTDAEHTELVTAGYTNAVRALPGRGIVIDSARTLSSNPLWLYVNTRLLFNFVKSSLKAAVEWARYEPNDETLWGKIEHNTLTPFLMGLWRRGAFGGGPPESCFSVQVDAGNNPADAVKQGLLTIEVYFYPSRPAETIVLTIGQQDAGTTVSEG